MTLQIIENATCTFCGCVCDDLRITVADGRIERTEGACHLAEPWFAALKAVEKEGSGRPQIGGQPAEVFEQALRQIAAAA